MLGVKVFGEDWRSIFERGFLDHVLGVGEHLVLDLSSLL
jgi:hypothetical protein